MNDFTYAELLLLHELVISEEHKIRKQVENDVWRNAFKIFRPGLFRKLDSLIDIERKLSFFASVEEKQDT